MPTYTGTTGDDVLVGGPGADTFRGGAGNDTYRWNLGDGNDTIDETDSGGLDRILFGAGITRADISLTSTSTSLVVRHIPSGSTITISRQNSDLRSVVERLQFADGQVIDLTAGLSMVGTTAGETVYGSLFRDSLEGAGGNDILRGLDGDDVLSGSGGLDNLYGGDGSDRLFGGDDADNLFGEDGDDYLQGGAGNDRLDGGEGNGDWAWYRGEAAAVTVNLATQTATGTAIGTDTLISIENAHGSEAGDSLVGSSASNVINGGGGNDTIAGGEGDDELLGGAGADQVDGGAGADRIFGDEPYSPNQTSTANGLTSTGSPIGISLTGARSDPDGRTSVMGYVGSVAPTSTALNIIYVIDRSGSMDDPFEGSETVGDLNGDGRSNTLMDGAIAAYTALNNSLIAAGLADARVTLVEFGSTGSTVYRGTAGQDANGNGIADVVESLRTLTATGGTYFDRGLQEAILALQGRGNEANYIFFESDGEPNGGAYLDEVSTLLNSYGARIRALALGNGASLPALDDVDDGVRNGSVTRVLTPSQLTAGLLNPTVNPASVDRVEVLLNGVVVQTFAGSTLLQTPFGLRFSADLSGLSTTAADVVTARIVTTGPNPVTLSTNLTIAQVDAPVGGDDILRGGDGDDRIQGDGGSDQLFGDAGNDTLIGGPGADRLDGGAGSDTADYSEEFQGVSIDLLNQVANGANVGVDTLVSIENATGGFGDDILRAHNGVAAATAVDVVKTQATANTSRASAVALGAVFSLQADANIVNSTTVPHATIRGVANGGGPEFYSITITAAGAVATFDIDGTSGFDTTLTLYDGNGTQLAFSDDAGGDAGSISSRDSYLSHTFAAPGVYYVAVGRYSYSGLAAGSTYTLNVSLPGGQINTALIGSTLSGGAGDDLLYSGASDDILNGGLGNDLASFSYSRAQATITYEPGRIIVTGPAGRDILIGIEALQFSDGVFDVRADGLVSAQPRGVIAGTAGADILVSGALSDTILGGDGNDLMRGQGGNDLIDGGAGMDLAFYAGARRQYAANAARVSGNGEGSDTLVNVEGAVFVDGVLSFDVDGRAAQVMRLYDAALDRLPDPDGFEAVLDLLEGGQTIQQVAAIFLNSPEFQSR